MAATEPRPSGRRRTCRAAVRTAATAVEGARSTSASMPARRRCATSITATTSRATPGGRGTRARRHGKAGDDLVLEVPPGTAVYDDASGELVADLVAVGQIAMVARGGSGGLGNTHFKTLDPPGPQARPEGRARRRAAGSGSSSADRRHRARRAAQRRQVDDPRRGHRRHARRSPTTRSRRSSRTSGSWTSASATSVVRRSPTCPA